MSRTLTTFLTGAAIAASAAAYEAKADEGAIGGTIVAHAATAAPTTQPALRTEAEINTELEKARKHLAMIPKSFEITPVGGINASTLSQPGSGWEAKAIPFGDEFYVAIDDPFSDNPWFVEVGDLSSPDADQAYITTNLATGKGSLTSNIIKVPRQAINKATDQPVRRVFADPSSICLEGKALEVSKDNPEVQTIGQGDISYTIPIRTIEGNQYTFIAGNDTFKQLKDVTPSAPFYLVGLERTSLNTGNVPGFEGLVYFQNDTRGFYVLEDRTVESIQSDIASMRTNATNRISGLETELANTQRKAKEYETKVQQQAPAKATGVQ